MKREEKKYLTKKKIKDLIIEHSERVNAKKIIKVKKGRKKIWSKNQNRFLETKIWMGMWIWLGITTKKKEDEIEQMRQFTRKQKKTDQSISSLVLRCSLSSSSQYVGDRRFGAWEEILIHLLSGTGRSISSSANVNSWSFCAEQWWQMDKTWQTVLSL